jgi:TonB family protein
VVEEPALVQAVAVVVPFWRVFEELADFVYVCLVLLGKAFDGCFDAVQAVWSVHGRWHLLSEFYLRYRGSMRKALLLTALVASATAFSRPADLLTAPPSVARKVSPAHTPQALRAGIEGTVVLYAEIGVDGRARRLRVIKGLGYGLDQQAIAAVRRWTFYPGMKNGVPATTPATIEVEFHLPRPTNRV